METPFTEIEQEVIEATKRAVAQYRKEVNGKSDGKLATSCIKKSFANCGKNRGYTVCTSGIDGCKCEWLYDMVWQKKDAEDNLIEIPMVMESEQSYYLKDIKYDFEKLLLANASLRVMICLAGPSGTQAINRIVECCKNAVSKYNVLPEGNRFLLLIWDDYYSDDIIYELIRCL